MKQAYLDCISGISGDMLLAALLDAGWEKKHLLDLPKTLNLGGVEIDIRKESRKGLAALKIDINCRETQPFRNLEALTSLIEKSALPGEIKDSSLSVLEMLARAEAKVHGCRLDEVHFHEIGAVDTVIDVTGVLLALRDLGISRVFSAPLPLSRGFVHSSHGRLPLPAPATLELLRGVPVYPMEETAELVTPTGAAIARQIVHSFGHVPEMKVIRTGYGAGARDLESVPNVLRVIIGEDGGPGADTDTVAEVSTLIDDMTPEQLAHLMDKVFQKGALDAWVSPVHMKKNRTGFELNVLCHPDKEEEIVQCILLDSSTIGVRLRHSRRFLLSRKRVTVMTSWGAIEAKLVVRPGGIREIIPEFESCRHIATKFDIPIRMVYSEAVKAGAGWEKN
jgi:uncharacterized protein (TIGR00299 family) protein